MYTTLQEQTNPARKSRGGGSQRQRQRRHRTELEHEKLAATVNGGTHEGVAIDDSSHDVEIVPCQGVLEMLPKGYGFLRDPDNGFRPTPHDVFVAAPLIGQYRLRTGNAVRGVAQQVRNQGGPRLLQVAEVDGFPADDSASVRDFDTLTPITPEQPLRLETGREPLSTRVIDLLTPLGKGQRGLIVAPPRTGKTVLLQQIGQAVAANHPDVELVMLLVDERPEEVTEMRRSIRGQVLASSLDNSAEDHLRLAHLTIERCKRLAERGRDVFLLVDSLTRLARASNKAQGNSGRTMSGGMDIKALDAPKKLFATARAFEEGGSLTIVATALIDTGSRMDELIFQEFKGTGNMELVLDRRLADRRAWPAIDLSQSGTRREEKLLDSETLHAVTLLRRTLSTMNSVDAMERLTTQLGKHPSNRAFLKLLQSARPE